MDDPDESSNQSLDDSDGAGSGNGSRQSRDLRKLLKQFLGERDDVGSGNGSGQGRDLRTKLSIDLAEAYEGTKKEVTLTRPTACDTCDGTGHPLDADVDTCSRCNGSGEVQQVKETPLGRVRQSSTCPQCEGETKLYSQECADCSGDGVVSEEATLTAQIPRGIEDGQVLRIEGEGVQIPNSQDGDLLIEVSVSGMDSLTRDGANLYREVSVPQNRLETGGTVEVEGVDDTITLNIPPNTSDETVFKIDGKGMPNLREEGHGDFHVNLRASDRDNKQERSIGPPNEVPTVPIDSVEYDRLSMGEEIGSGGYEVVVQATVTTGDFEGPIAVKRPPQVGTMSVESVERVLNEAETWDKLDNHDHIVSVIDYGRNPVPWIAMEHMDGGHLGERAGKIPNRQAIWIAYTVAAAVYHAHRQGVAHLDLKPENVLFQTIEGAWDVPKVTDWGLSKRLLDNSSGAVGRSPAYAAPEQFDDDCGTTDELTDIYQLGAICFELFTGQPPFDRTTPVADRVTESLPDPRAVTDVPDEIADVVTTAMAPNRNDRYEHVVYLRDRLREAYQSVRRV